MKEKKEQASIRDLKHREILSLDEVSRLYGVRKSWLYSMVHRKKIPYIKLPGMDGRVAPTNEQYK